MRPLLYALLIPVIAIELTVAVLAMMPKVDERYRAFFIDRTSDCWRLAPPGTYTMGATVSFLPPKRPEITNLMRCGWLGPQDTGLWSVGSESELRIAVADPPSDLLLDLELIPFNTTERPVQTIRIFINGRGLDTLQLEGTEARHVVIPIPADYVAEGEERIDIGFGFPGAYAPADVGINDDDRRLSIRLLSLRLTKAE
jgi:hypothetical protein